MNKRKIQLSIAAVIVAASINFLTSCQKEADSVAPQNETSSTSLTDDALSRHGLQLQPFNENHYGKMGADWWEWVLSFDCAHNPMEDQTGAFQNQGQHGGEFFLGGGHFNHPVTRSVTIPKNKSIFFPLITLISDDTTGLAASGLSLKDFLLVNATGPVDGVDILTATLDGQNLVSNPFDYRAHSKLFTFQGNPDVANCIDPIVNGTKQSAVTDGYWMWLKSLPAGQHMLHFTGGISGPGLVIDVTYNITQL